MTWFHDSKNPKRSGVLHLTRHTCSVLTGHATGGRDINVDGPPCRTLADMTPDEIARLERQYGCRVISPAVRMGVA